MKSPILGGIIMSCVAVISFICGTFVGSHEAGPAGVGSPTNSHSAVSGNSSESAAPNATSAVQATIAPAALTNDAARTRIFQVLSEPNRVTRMQRLCELLAQLSSENWRSAVDAFAVQTATEGRWQLDEWHLMIERVGEVAGAEALDEAIRLGKASDIYRAQKVLTGFASAEPKAAVEWFNKQAPELRPQLFNSLLAGLGRSDGKSAIALILDQPRETWEPGAAKIVQGAMQSGGFRAGEELFEFIKSRADFPDPLKVTILFELVQRKITTGADGSKLLGWLDAHVEMLGPNSMKETMTYAARSDASKALAWVEGRAGRIQSPQVPLAYGIVGGNLQSQKPAEFASWLAANPDHPQRDLMIHGGAKTLFKEGKIKEAQQLGATIRDPQLRAEIENSIRSQQNGQ